MLTLKLDSKVEKELAVFSQKIGKPVEQLVSDLIFDLLHDVRGASMLADAPMEHSWRGMTGSKNTTHTHLSTLH